MTTALLPAHHADSSDALSRTRLRCRPHLTGSAVSPNAGDSKLYVVAWSQPRWAQPGDECLLSDVRLA
jgi:hypothetical protein